MNYPSQNSSKPFTVISLAGMMIVLSLLAAPCTAKVLFLAHFNDGVNADYALGNEAAGPAPRSGLDLTGLTPDGRWGNGLDLGNPQKGNCTFEATRNFDPLKGTVDFWYRIDQAPKKYNPIFCWYVHEGADGSGKTSLKTSGLELYRYGQSLVFAVYQPYAQTSTRFEMDLGNWHHMEINWDCSGGDGASVYNVYLDGRSVIRMTDTVAFKSGGGFLHPGLWDHAWSGIALRGHFDELRVTDQVEHLSSFIPPERAYPDPGTAGGVAAVYLEAQTNLEKLTRGLEGLKRAATLAGSGPATAEAAQVIKSSEAAAQTAAASLKSVRKVLEAASILAGASKENWLAHFQSLGDEPASDTGLDLEKSQSIIDQAADSTKTALGAVAQATGALYVRIPDVYNDVMVHLGYLRDEVEALKRAIGYGRTVADTTPSVQTAEACDGTIRKGSQALDEICARFYGMFEDSPGARTDPVNALLAFSADHQKAQTMEMLSGHLSEVADLIGRSRKAIDGQLQRLRSDPGFEARFPAYHGYVPAELPPVEVAPDGTLKRLIFAGAYGRTETMLSLGFDTLDETGVRVKWVTKDRFETGEDPKTVAQWKNFKTPLSNTVLLYAVGDSMYRPPWFQEIHGDSLDYYFDNSEVYKGSTGFDYRHPVPRAMILEYLENAARINGAKPYTFIYKGPWEAHPYRGFGVDVPGKRTVGFKEHGFSEVAVKAFRAYLKQKYASIVRLNRAWRSTYGSFEDIQPPDPLIRAFVVTRDERGQSVYTLFFPNKRLPGASTTPLTYEFERCRKDLYADYLADCYQAIKRGDPKRPLASSTSGGIMGEILVNSLDDLQMAQRCVDMWGKHASGGYGWAESPYMYGLNRYFNKTLVALEYYGWAQEVIGDDFWPSFELAQGATVEDVYNAGRRDVWHELTWDRRMLLFYWTQKLVEMQSGVREATSPMVRPWASLIPVVKRRATNLNDVFINVPIVKPRIAVLHPGVSIINAYPTNGCNKITRDICDRLISKQYHFGIVPETFIMNGRDSLDHYDVLILPYVQYFADGFANKLLDWVRRGGTLISAGPFGLYDRYGFDLKDGAAEVFPYVEFSFPTPDEYEVSWNWQAKRKGRELAKGYLATKYGRGRVLLAVDGRAFSRSGFATAEAHVGTEIGAEVQGEDATASTADEPAKPDDRIRPLKLEADGDLRPTVRAFYDALQNATQRQAWVTAGNVELVLRQKNSTGPLYLSLLNWDYRDPLETEVVVRGEYKDIVDLSIPDGFPVPSVVNQGLTTFAVAFGPGEGLMLRLQP